MPILLALALLPATPQPPSSLAALRDHYRPLLIFAPDPDLRHDPQLSQQLQLLTPHRADLLDRQILLIPFIHKYAGQVDTEILTLLPREEPALRRRFHIPSQTFTVILLGKDGGEKFRATTPIPIDQLNQLIDAMPMRQQEMQPHPQR